MVHDYVLKSMALELQKIDAMKYPQEKYKKDLLKIGENINYYTPCDKIKLMLIVIYNMF